VIVVDDGSTDATCQKVQALSLPGIPLLSDETDLGKTQPYAVVCKKSRGRLPSFKMPISSMPQKKLVTSYGLLSSTRLMWFMAAVFASKRQLASSIFTIISPISY